MVILLKCFQGQREKHLRIPKTYFNSLSYTDGAIQKGRKLTMKKRLAVLLTGAMVMATLAGCGGGAAETAAPATETPAAEEAPVAEEAPAAEETPAAEEAPAADGELIKVGIINNDPSESGYRTANDADLKAAFTKENGYDASFAYGNPAVGNANEDQVKAAQQFIQDGVDYLLLSAADTAGWDTVLQDAQDAGVSVILFDRTIDADEGLYAASIVSDMDKEGQTAVDWLANQNLETYNIIHIQGQMGSAAQQGRTKALDEKVAAEANWNMVEQQTASWNAENAQQIVQSVIDSGKEFNVIYAENDDMAKGAVAALDAANISHGVGKDVIIMGFDCNKWALEELLAGNWNYDGQCNPFQSSYIDDVIKTLESGGTPAEKVIIMEEKGFDATTITQEDVDHYGI